MNMTVVFPDSTLPEPTNGVFETQEEFRAYVMKSQNGRWNSELHARPTAERLADYKDDTIADAFPRHFPFGFTGLAEDPSVIKLRKFHKKHLDRDRLEVLRKFLQHRIPEFHSPMFNLIVENLVMKETIFKKTQMYCNVKSSDQSSMGEKYGSMSAAALERAIHDVRNHLSVQHSNSSEHQYLKSIRAACKHLPHSNEASVDARTKYFSFLIRFGLPCIFLTISPDDLRNYRIIVYALNGTEKANGFVDVKELSDDQILADFKVRQQARFDHPGLCAEEYERIIELVIKHMFNWNEKEQKSEGVGLFAEVLAWCIATEEQGRKSLHGHMLLFIKDWQTVLEILQRRQNMDSGEIISLAAAEMKTKRLYRNACSAELFSDIGPGKALPEKAAFHHEDCRGTRREEQMRFAVKPVDDKQLREMRHKRLCHQHQGQIATCEKCHTTFSMNLIVSNAISTHLGKPGQKIKFPEGNNTKRLDRFVYEMGKDFSWNVQGEKSKALRYFASNALTNVHFVSHSTRCFKKGSECYANLPDAVTTEEEIIYNEEPDSWSNWLGRKEIRWMFRLQPKRPISAVFMNTHNPTLTSLLGCNNNVMLGMNGRLVLYVTGYNVKSQQKEERAAFEAVSKVMVKQLQNQVCVCRNGIIKNHPAFANTLIVSYVGICNRVFARTTIGVPSGVGWCLFPHSL
jgi:hypothetical protein